jgi:anti-sigma factor RsiW
MEKAYQGFQKKIVPYLDGSLSKDEKSEFEAFVLTHPEFEEQINFKKNEISLLQSMIPHAILSKESAETLENEMRASVFNLLKEEPKSFFDSLRIKWEEFVNR